jgi:sugar O-acyltransferase (sialic acid O-acetyltransferase NeuD family)
MGSGSSSTAFKAAVMTERYIIWGSSGHAMVLGDILLAQGKSVVALFDNDTKARPAVEGVEIFYGRSGFESWLECRHDLQDIRFLIAIGGAKGKDRLALNDYLISRGLAPGKVISTRASVSPSASIGAGSQILDGAIVAARASLGRQCIVNHGTQVDHESSLADGVHLAPGAILCGSVRVGESAFLGAGCVVLPRLEIGYGATVGAGAVVTRNVPDGAKVVGNPARQIN